jgi:peptide/nickel transport system permease protein
VTVAPLTADEAQPKAARVSRGGSGIIRRLARRRLALICIAYLVVVAVVAIVAPLVLPAVAHEQAGDLLAVRQGPTWQHLLGTDSLGRDELNRLLVGTRESMVALVEFLAVVLAVGVPLGLVAGYFGGWVDRVIGRFIELIFALPGLVIVLVVFSVFPRSLLAGMVTLGIIASPGLIRIVRSVTLPVREELYIAAARVSGLSRPYIISRHILPRVVGAVVVQASLYAAAGIGAVGGLAYLGFGAAPPSPTWGGMLQEGITNIVLQPWLIWPPGIAMALTILAFGLLGDALRDTTTETWQTPIRRARRRRVAYIKDAQQTGFPSYPRDSPLLSIEGLSVAFPSPAGSVSVIEDVTFEVAAGETVGLVGESGCGKTVTATSLLGLLPGDGEITGGRILFEGHDLAGMSERDLRKVRGREIALISQEPMVSLNPALRVGWQLAHVLRVHHRLPRREAHDRAVDLLERVRLADPVAVARRYPHELSGGMAQRVAIARALAGEPKLLIADEPTTALDVTVQAEILDLLRDLQRERKMAILLVTHDWGVIADLCDRAVVMYAGEVVERAELRSIFHEPMHPYTEALLASNPRNATESDMLLTIPGLVPKPGAWPDGCHFHPRCRYATTACRRGSIPLERPAAGREARCIHIDRLTSVR